MTSRAAELRAELKRISGTAVSTSLVHAYGYHGDFMVENT